MRNAAIRFVRFNAFGPDFIPTWPDEENPSQLRSQNVFSFIQCAFTNVMATRVHVFYSVQLLSTKIYYHVYTQGLI